MKKTKHTANGEEATPLRLKNSVTAKNKEQKAAIRAIIEHPITFIMGQAGCGKSYISIGIACEHLVRGKIDKIVVCRPLEFTGKNLGALPGDIEEKTYCWFIHVKEYLIHFLGLELYKKLKIEGRITFQPLEILRGLNLERTTMILEEVQNVTTEQCKAALTRINDDESRIILVGDRGQPDVKRPDIDYLIGKLEQLDEVAVCYLEESFRHPVVEKVSKLI